MNANTSPDQQKPVRSAAKESSVAWCLMEFWSAQRFVRRRYACRHPLSGLNPQAPWRSAQTIAFVFGQLWRLALSCQQLRLSLYQLSTCCQREFWGRSKGTAWPTGTDLFAGVLWIQVNLPPRFPDQLSASILAMEPFAQMAAWQYDQYVLHYPIP